MELALSQPIMDVPDKMKGPRWVRLELDPVVRPDGAWTVKDPSTK